MIFPSHSSLTEKNEIKFLVAKSSILSLLHPQRNKERYMTTFAVIVLVCSVTHTEMNES